MIKTLREGFADREHIPTTHSYFISGDLIPHSDVRSGTYGIMEFQKKLYVTHMRSSFLFSVDSMTAVASQITLKYQHTLFIAGYTYITLLIGILSLISFYFVLLSNIGLSSLSKEPQLSRRRKSGNVRPMAIKISQSISNGSERS